MIAITFLYPLFSQLFTTITVKYSTFSLFQLMSNHLVKNSFCAIYSCVNSSKNKNNPYLVRFTD